MLRITSDWHIHTHNSCDEASLTIADLIQEAGRLGINDFGITDHVHTPYNLPDIRSSRQEFLENQPSLQVHFGVEVSCVSQWEIDEIAKGGLENPVYGLRSGGEPDCKLAIGITEREVASLGIEYVVGGTHWPMYIPYEREVVIRDYHRQNMFLATHSLVTIVAHPWWWHGHWQDVAGNYPAEPWFDDFNVIPASMHAEFADAVVEQGKVVEINLEAILLNRLYPERFKQQYLEYLAGLKDRGVRLSVGSDCHDRHYEIDFKRAERMLEIAGFNDKDFWCLAPRDA
jgi:histidinol phosphatase-like PHP family hydrolase